MGVHISKCQQYQKNKQVGKTIDNRETADDLKSWSSQPQQSTTSLPEQQNDDEKTNKNNLENISRAAVQSDEENATGSADQDAQEEKKKVLKAWDEISESQDKWLAINRNRSARSRSPLGWKLVRIFVSSTFSDFYAERDVLVKTVIPALNEWCKSRKIRLVECDLRWGIPKDTTTEDTIEICLEEIERCMVETGGQAFFLNLLGERYGWIPNFNLISDEIIQKFNLVESISITHMEILHAAIRSQSPNAVFFLRDKSVISKIPERFHDLFVETTVLGKESLVELKARIIEQFPSQVFNYQCNFEKVENSLGIERVVLTDLDDFCLKTFEFFKNAIDKAYPGDGGDLTADDLNLLNQDVFIESKGSIVVGRHKERKEIMQFLMKSTETDEINTENYLIVIGRQGIGKSSLLANVVRKAKAKKFDCVYNFANASSGSTVSSSVQDIVTTRLLSLFKSLFETEIRESEIKDNKPQFDYVIKKLLDNNEKVILVFDAVNQFSDNDAFLLEWLPKNLHKNIKCLISCTDDSRFLPVLRETITQNNYQEIKLEGFGIDDSKNYVTSLLARYNKKLDDDQLKTLLSFKEAVNPLWLALACEELRIFGVFEKLTDKIKQLPDTLIGLIKTILHRLISEDKTGLVKDAVCLLVCSTSGLTETELRWSLGDGKDPVPLMNWTKCRLVLQPYLLITGRRQDEETLTFFHNSINLMINEMCFTSPEIKENYHQMLANSFANHCDDDARVSSELPEQLLLAKQNGKLVEFLRKDKRSIRVGLVRKSNYMTNIRCKTFLPKGDNKFSFPVYLCNMCSVRTNAYTPQPGLNKDMCLVCGNRVHFKDSARLANYCMRHSKRAAPGNAHCCNCNRIIFLSQNPGMSYSNMYLCQMCSCRGNKCAYIEH